MAQHPATRRRSLIALLRDRRGAVGLYFALVAGAMMVLGLTGIDLMRVHLVRSRLWAAADAAMLAAGRSLGTTTTWAEEGAAYFNANMGESYMGTTVTVSEKNFVRAGDALNGQFVSLDITASVPLLTTGFTGLGSLDISVSAQAKRVSRKVELAMILDNTGSMATNDNIGALRTDAQLLVNTLANGATVSLPAAWIALVPFSAAVNPGSVSPSLVSTADAKTYDPDNVEKWKGCLIERSSDNAMADTDASVEKWGRYFWMPSQTDNDYSLTNPSSVKVGQSYGNGATGPNLGCPTPITPLTSDIATLTAAINAMQAWYRGGTLGDIGMAWGLRVLSPTAPFSEGVAWGTASVTKAVVMMTDGDTNFNGDDYTGYKRLSDGYLGTTNRDTAIATVNTRLETMCATMKTRGIVIYSIVFGSNVSTDTATRYQTCASGVSNYFVAVDQAGLKQAFTSIAGALSELTIVK